jgi:hypothetical protein
MTTQFITAAELMRRVHGAEELPFVAIDHPISSASIEELGERARKAVDESAAILTGAQDN